MHTHKSAFVLAVSTSSPSSSTEPMRAMTFSPGSSTQQYGQIAMQTLYIRAWSKRRNKYGMQNSCNAAEIAPDAASATPISAAWIEDEVIMSGMSEERSDRDDMKRKRCGWRRVMRERRN